MPRVTFADCVEVYPVPSQAEEDRTSPWMLMAVNRAHFLSRIQQVSDVILPAIEKRNKRLADFRSRIQKAEEELGPVLLRSLITRDQAAV